MLGGPGAGKSTLLARFILAACAAGLEDPAAPLPIFIPLAELARTGQWYRETFPEFLRARLRFLGVDGRYGATLLEGVTSGHAVLCLDALDEVTPDRRPDIIAWIHGLAAPVEGGALIIGSRFTDYKGADLREAHVYEWELLPLPPEARAHLAHTLLQRLSRRLGDSMEVDVQRLLEELGSHPQLATWGENPLLLTLAICVFGQLGYLPARRALLYEAVVDAILATHNLKERTLLPEVRTVEGRVSAQTTHTVVADLALELFLHRGRTFTTTDLATVLRQQCINWGVILAAEQDALYERILGSGLLEPVAEGVYGFGHLTLQEYLAGRALARRVAVLADRESEHQEEDIWVLLRRKRTMSRWIEPLRLMVGALVSFHGSAGRQIAQQWLNDLAAQDETEDGDPGYLCLTLALRSLSELTDTPERDDGMRENTLRVWAELLLEATRSSSETLQERLLATAESLRLLSPAALDATVTMLVEACHARDWQVRKVAIQALTALGNRAPESLLIEAAGDSDSQVRQAALVALDQRAPIAVLLAALDDLHDHVSEAAVQILAHLGARAPIATLVDCISASNAVGYRRRVEAIRALGQLGAYAPIPVLEQALADLQSDIVQAAAFALADLDAVGAWDTLLKLLAHKDQQVQGAAYLALERLSEGKSTADTYALLAESDWRLRRIAIHSLGHAGDSAALETLIGLLADADFVIASAAADQLYQHARRLSLTKWQSLLDSQQWIARGVAALALARFPQDAPVDAMAAVLNDDYPGDLFGIVSSNYPVCRAALLALGQVGTRAPVAAMAAKLDDPNVVVRRTAVKALAEVDLPEAQQALHRALEDDDPGVRLRAISALARRGGRAAALAVQTGLADANVDVRFETRRLLHHADLRLPVDDLQSLLARGSFYVEEVALRVLGHLGERAPLPLIESELTSGDDFVRSAAVGALGALGARLPRQLVEAALSDPEPVVVEVAEKVLNRTESTPVADSVGDHDLEDDRLDRVALMIFVALGLFRDTTYFESMSIRDEAYREFSLQDWADLLRDGDLIERIDAIVKLSVRGAVAGSPALLAEMERALEDRDAKVRLLALATLVQFGAPASVEPALATTVPTLLEDQDPTIRCETVRVFGAWGAPVPLSLLDQPLHDKDAKVRQMAVRVLEHWGERAPP